MNWRASGVTVWRTGKVVLPIDVMAKAERKSARYIHIGAISRSGTRPACALSLKKRTKLFSRLKPARN
jgi:hypothetical protein